MGGPDCRSAEATGAPGPQRTRGRQDLHPAHSKISQIAAHWWSVPWNGHEVWYYDLGGDTLWGATARMVRSLVGLL